jgi:hypothetical protein
MKKIKMVFIIMSFMLVACSKSTTHTTRDPSSNDDPWTDWSRGKSQTAGLLILKRIREELLDHNIYDPHIDYKGYGNKICDLSKIGYRSADGTCYDTNNPYVGAAGVAFGRNIAPEFIDYTSHQKMMTPNPSLVSEAFFTRDKFKPVPFLNMLAASWIQFMNHDWLAHGKNDETRSHKVMNGHGKIEKVEHTKKNTTSASSYRKEYGKTTINEVTHWWDGSQIYGSNFKTQKKLRAFKLGKMKMVKKNGQEFLPKNTKLNTKRNKLNRGHEVTGFGDNWWVGLSMLHHLFVKEHNHIANMLYKKHVMKKKKNGLWVWNQKTKLGKTFFGITKDQKNIRYFNDKELDEHIFQVSRLINAAVMAKIHTIEWTPAILDNQVLRKGMYTNWYGLANPATWTSRLC